MAIFAPSQMGPGFPGEAGSYTAEDVNRWRMQSPIDETRAPTSICSIDMIADKINSCAKARVLAIMAFNLFVFDGQLSRDRSNWACPFGHCKLNFADQKTLMQHVLECPHFSKDGVFCNCCTKDDRFEEHCRNDRAESIASHGTEKSSTKKRNPIRKFSNIIFSRNKTESRASSPGSECPVSPASTHRRPSIFSMIPTPTPSSTSRKGSSPTPLESPRDTVGSPSPGRNEIASELIGSEPLIIRGVQELQGLELPCELSGATRAQELQGAMFADLMDMNESPTKELSMDSMIPSQEVLRAYNTSFTHQMEASQTELPPTNGLSSAFQPHGQHQSPWFMQQHASRPHLNLQVCPAAGQELLYATDGDHAGLPVLPPNPQPQHEGFFPRGKPASIQVRKASGDSGYSEDSNTMMVVERVPQSSQSSFSGVRMAASASHAAPILASPNAGAALPVGERLFHCPYPGCSYSPGGHPRKHAAYLTKHINTKHLRCTQVRCVDCGNMYSRSDNLKVHQEGACLRARSLAAPYPPHRSARRAVATQRREWGDGWQVE